MTARTCRARAIASLLLSVAAALSTGCQGTPKPKTSLMARFNPALCKRPPPEDVSKLLDPRFDGVKADLSLLSRTVTSTKGVRIAVTFRNAGLKGVTLTLPQNAFTLAGFTLVDHDCVPVAYATPPTAHALSYRDSGPMPLNVGESATVDASLDDLAPGLVLEPGIYAIRLNLRIDPPSQLVRGRTILSDWALFAVTPP